MAGELISDMALWKMHRHSSYKLSELKVAQTNDGDDVEANVAALAPSTAEVELRLPRASHHCQCCSLSVLLLCTTK